MENYTVTIVTNDGFRNYEHKTEGAARSYAKWAAGYHQRAAKVTGPHGECSWVFPD